MQEHFVIIGGVAAGAKAAAKARRENPELKISIYNEGKYISYSACGMPYYIEDVFSDENRLLVRKPEVFKEKDNIDVYLRHKVTSISPENQTIKVTNLETSEEFDVPYTKLLIATGSKPYIPPSESVLLGNIFTLRTIDDAIAIKNAIPTSKRALIIGAGPIGMEMAEAFAARGLNTTILELANQIIPQIDQDFAIQVQKYVEEKGVNIVTGESFKRFLSSEDGFVRQIETNSGLIIDVDLVILSIGVRPNVELAVNSGIKLGPTGAIQVNSKMETSIPDIYAAGDCAETFHLVSKQPVWVPLGSTANKQGRVAAVNATGGNEEFKGVLGSFVTRIFDFTVSKTGLSEKEAQKYGYDYEISIVPHRDRAGYMPEAAEIIIKLIADKKTRKLLGGQVIGKGDADKRINTIATALTANMTVDEFLDIDLTYAPPYSPSIDPVLTAAQVLQNKLEKKAEGVNYQELNEYLTKNKKFKLIDIRNKEEFNKKHVNCAENIPFDEIDLSKFNKDEEKDILICCNKGIGGYLVSSKLKKAGYKNIKFVDGGVKGCMCGFCQE